MGFYRINQINPHNNLTMIYLSIFLSLCLKYESMFDYKLNLNDRDCDSKILLTIVLHKILVTSILSCMIRCIM